MNAIFIKSKIQIKNSEKFRKLRSASYGTQKPELIHEKS